MKIIGPELPNIPWEERPHSCQDVVWRYSKNPIIPRDLIPSSNSIFNSAVVPYRGEFRGVFRCDDKRRAMQLHVGRSQDGLKWEIENERIRFQPAEGISPLEWEYGYDPRVCWIEDRYYITWCNGFGGWPTIGVAYTYDFQSFYQLENAFLPYNRNGVLFPRRINGNFAMLSRPSDRGHTPFGDIYYSESPDMIHWGKHRLVMEPAYGWQNTKIGAGPVPIETTEGWLLFYHGVLTSCNGFVYSMGAALLDLEQPWKVLFRTAPYLLHPKETYEQVGDVPNVVFPCAALADAATGRVAIYYGGADTVTCLAFCRADEVMAFMKENRLPLRPR
ncbi:MAG: glycoside hydrolase family 130 protein [Candidatus Acetothermia bacterium]|jgi:beta-1,4-mannooligosaccharide/beta-1,4-mannosyl-N-acetylglucosamine phosphorylase|nr:glycoside hydrolase family 130 protein [Candidatus Acetothermia bacterium]